MLLVEDEEMLLTLSRSMLETLGFTVIATTNGNEALAAYEQNAAEICLVLTDLGMPLMDGYKLIQELKKLVPTLPIIICSGFGDIDVGVCIKREDICGIVSKPYNFEQLRETLRSVCEQSSL